MIENKVKNSGERLEKATIFLKRSLKESSRIERGLERKSLALKKKIVEDRSRTLKRLASGGRDRGRGGVLGGALSILGFGTGAGGLGILSRKIRRPTTPTKLLKVPQGTSLSRLGRVGRIGRLAKPLAVVGAGLDFVGRKAEGQTNTQAGVGAAGGFAGGLAGAKIGASIGTLAGPVGTIIGGAGGAIIGSLAGGRIGDLFTGANRRRQFEEERVQIRTSETLFSESLDDFDRVLDKLEKLSPNLTLKSLTDDKKIRKFDLDDFTPPPPPPPPTKKPNQEPKDIKVPEDAGITVEAFLAFLAVVGISIAMFIKLDLSEQLTIFAVFVVRQTKKVLSKKALEELFKRILPNLVKKKTVETPVSKVEVITDKTLNKVLDKILKANKRPTEGLQKSSITRSERLESIMRNLNIVKKFNIQRYKRFLDALQLAEDVLSFDDFVKMSKRELDEFSGKILLERTTDEINRDLELVERFAKGDSISEILGDMPEGTTIKDIKNAVKAARDTIASMRAKKSNILTKGEKASLDIIDQILEERIKVLDKRQELKGVQINKDLPFDSTNLEKLFRESKEGATFRKLMDALKLLREGTPLSSLEPSSSSNIASLPSKDIFFLGQNGNNLSPVNNSGGNSTIAVLKTENPLRQVMSIRQVNQLITT